MSLKAVHVLFVALAALVSLGAGAWGIAEGGALYAGLGGASFALAAGLVAYGVVFWRKMKEAGIS